MQKAYSRINWKDEPSLDTPLGANNLNKMDSALDVIDNRVLSLSGYEGRVQASEKNAKASEVNAKTSENNAKESEELAREYAERAFNTTPEGYEQIVDTVQKMDIKESADTTLLDSKAGGYKLLSMSGNSVQKTYKGKNLLNNTATNTTTKGVTFTIKDDGSVVANGTPSEDVDLTLGTYGGTTNILPISTGDVIVTGTGTDKISVYTNLGYNVNGNDFNLTLVDKGITYVIYRVKSGATLSNYTFYPMIRKATETDATYEPYVGGTPSPNPDFPQSIHNVGDRIEVVQGHYNADKLTVVDNAVCCKRPISCNAGDVMSYESEYTLRFVFQFYDADGYCFSPSNGIATGTSGSIVAPVGSSYFTFYINKYVDGNRINITPDDVGIIPLKINGKYVVQIPYANKNLWTLGDQTFVKAQAISVDLPSGTYTLSALVTSTDTDATTSLIRLYDETLSSYQAIQLDRNARNSGTITIEKRIARINFYASSSNGDSDGDTVTFADIQLERGEVMTDYEEHKEKVATVLLNAPLRDTDVMSRTEVVRKRASVTYNGTEGWRFLTEQGVNYAYMPPIANAKPNSLGMCNLMASTNVGLIDNNFFLNGNSYPIFCSNNITSVDEWKALLTETPCTVEYELATPIVETLDSTSQIALNSLETFDSVTYINVDSRTQPKGIKGEYGTSKVGARTIKNELKNDTLEIKYNELVSTLLANNEVEEVEEVLEGDEE